MTQCIKDSQRVSPHLMMGRVFIHGSGELSDAVKSLRAGVLVERGSVVLDLWRVSPNVAVYRT